VAIVGPFLTVYARLRGARLVAKLAVCAPILVDQLEPAGDPRCGSVHQLLDGHLGPWLRQLVERRPPDLPSRLQTSVASPRTKSVRDSRPKLEVDERD
jgi:hypothetical protein